MKFRTKMCEVIAVSVERIVNTAKEDFSKLPAWVKKEYQEGKLFIGFNSVVVDDCYSCEKAELSDIILTSNAKRLVVMKREEFFDRYEDAFCPDNKTIV